MGKVGGIFLDQAMYRCGALVSDPREHRPHAYMMRQLFLIEWRRQQLRGMGDIAPTEGGADLMGVIARVLLDRFGLPRNRMYGWHWLCATTPALMKAVRTDIRRSPLT